MCEKTSAQRFRHHFLINGAILTVCTELQYETRQVRVGWSVFNPNDSRWIRKMGNQIARNRLHNNSIYFVLSEAEPVLCDYISLKALMVILGNSLAPPEDCPNPADHPSAISAPTRQAIQVEMIAMIDLLGQRVGLSSLRAFL